MINASKYTQSTLSKFDIIGSYFVNLFYNEFYSKSKILKLNGTFINLTEAYKNILGSYLDFIKKPEFFKQIVKGIHAYCISTTKYTTMTHKECIDFMVHEFIPEKLWDSIRENQKNKLFHESIGNCITIFIENIINNRIHIIIDNHDQPENIIILQDLFLSIILLEKDKIYSKFLNPNNNNTISIELFKTKLLSLVNEKKGLITENTLLKKNYGAIRQLNEKNANVVIELQKAHKLYIKEINMLKKENSYMKNLLAKEGKQEIGYGDIRYNNKTLINKQPDTKQENIKLKIEKISKIEKKNDIELLSNSSDDDNSSISSNDSNDSNIEIPDNSKLFAIKKKVPFNSNTIDNLDDNISSLLCGGDGNNDGDNDDDNNEEIDTINNLVFDNNDDDDDYLN